MYLQKALFIEFHSQITDFACSCKKRYFSGTPKSHHTIGYKIISMEVSYTNIILETCDVHVNIFQNVPLKRKSIDHIIY